MMLTLRCTALFLGMTASVGLAGCVQPSGPVFGEWRGQTPGPNSKAPKSVDLELYGAPDAQTGAYHMSSLESEPGFTVGHDTRAWGGTWVRSQRVVDGRTITIITLKDPLPGDIGAYTLADDGTLHALDPNGLPDTTPAGALYTLAPVKPRPPLL